MELHSGGLIEPVLLPSDHISPSSNPTDVCHAETSAETVQLGPNHFSRSVRVVTPAGLHLRPLKNLVELANTFAADIRLSRRDGKAVDGKSILQLMALAAEYGTELQIEAVGQDAEAAVEGIGQLIESNFTEETT